MFQSFRILSFIGARGGSQGIKNKNIVDFAGNPLINWTIQASLESRYIDRTIVSTDSLQIAQIAQKAGADVPFLRPAKIAQDGSPIDDALSHGLKWIKNKEGYIYDYLLLLQPTSPLRTAKHIDAAISYYFKNRRTKQDTLVSVKKMEKKIGWLMKKNKNGYINFCFDASRKKILRQSLPEYYLPNGAIFLAPIELILKKGHFYQSHVLPFLMEEDSSIDIDSLDDLKRALGIWKNK